MTRRQALPVNAMTLLEKRQQRSAASRSMQHFRHSKQYRRVQLAGYLRPFVRLIMMQQPMMLLCNILVHCLPHANATENYPR